MSELLYLGTYNNERVYTEVDDEDVLYLIEYSWHLGRKKYATRTSRKTGIHYMHREIAKRMGLDISKRIDHIDTNPLNNKRNNLRECTQSQNVINSKLSIANTTGYKGVHYFKRDNNYRAYISYNKKCIHIGYYDTAYEAHLAREKRGRELFGEFYNNGYND